MYFRKRAVGSVAVNNYDYGHGNIGGGEYTWNMMGTFGPIVIGFQYGWAYGAAGDVIWTGADLIYRGAVEFYDVINNNYSFDFSNSMNIMIGFSPNH